MDECICYQQAMQSVSDTVFLTDDEGAILFVSPNIRYTFGCSVDEAMRSANIQTLVGGLLVASDRLDKKGEVKNIEVRITDKRGHEHLMLAKIKRIALTGASRLYSFQDITDHKKIVAKLEKLNEELLLRVEEKTTELQRKNIALSEVLSQLEIEKQNLASKVNVNVQKILLPVIGKLIEKSSAIDSRYLMMIKQNLEGLTSSIGVKLVSTAHHLTPKELELCTLIKGGFSAKEIATMQNLSERTIECHRYSIRKKLGLASSKANLAAYLAQL